MCPGCGRSAHRQSFRIGSEAAEGWPIEEVRIGSQPLPGTRPEPLSTRDLRGCARTKAAQVLPGVSCLPRYPTPQMRDWSVHNMDERPPLICGYFACETQLSQVFLSGLPRVFKVSIRGSVSGQWLENSIRHSVDDVDVTRPGEEAVVSKLSEGLFVETLREYIAHLPPDQIGWLAGARDPEVGKALALMHRSPARPWTIASLATEVGLSRSVLAERFRHYLNEPPHVISDPMANATGSANAFVHQLFGRPNCCRGGV